MSQIFYGFIIHQYEFLPEEYCSRAERTVLILVDRKVKPDFYLPGVNVKPGRERSAYVCLPREDPAAEGVSFAPRPSPRANRTRIKLSVLSGQIRLLNLRR